tara:strand:+ start:244 stop:459 length:216 start_codon:yes stop_codon:yes gene_type:complete
MYTVKAELRVVEWRIIRKHTALDEAIIEYVSVLLVDNVPVPTKEPIVITKRLTSAQSELLDLILLEEKGQV